MAKSFYDFVLNHRERFFLPIGNYAGLNNIGANVRQAVTDAAVQFAAATETQALLRTQVLLTGMDLSVEAEVFGSSIRMVDNEVPAVFGRLIHNPDQIKNLNSPQVGDGRTSVYLDAVNQLVVEGNKKDIPVFAGMIGPFSLASRLFGVSETLELTATNPNQVLRLLEKVMPFLLDYASAFSSLGAQGIILAEPAAGLLSPRALATFSTPYIKMVVENCQNDQFKVVYHNCGARAVHLEKILECGAAMVHFGAPMDMVKVLEQVNETILVGGNLDPAEVFVLGEKDFIREKTIKLLTLTQNYTNFFLSSGCEIPPDVNLDKLLVCKDAVQDFNGKNNQISALRLAKI